MVGDCCRERAHYSQRLALPLAFAGNNSDHGWLIDGLARTSPAPKVGTLILR